MAGSRRECMIFAAKTAAIKCLIFIEMSEAEMNSYRFGTGKEPTDETLAQIMHEAAAEAKKK